MEGIFTCFQDLEAPCQLCAELGVRLFCLIGVWGLGRGGEAALDCLGKEALLPSSPHA